MMNSIGRTASNKIRLRLKGFHRRVMRMMVVKSLLDCDVKLPPMKRLGSSSSGGNGEVKGSFIYVLEELKATGCSIQYPYYSYKKIFRWTFNKSQLVGKLVIVSGTRYRVKEKAKKLERKFYY